MMATIAQERLDTVQAILQELAAYGEAHADEAWAAFVRGQAQRALTTLAEEGNEDSDYVPFSDQTLAERYAYVKEQDAKTDMVERVRKLLAPNPLFADINGEDDE